MKVEILNYSNYPKPRYETEGAAGMDLYANIEDSIFIEPQHRILIPTGIHLKLPKNIEAQVRSRSGLALKHGISVLNSPGTIDPDYRGEIGVILVNHSGTPFEVTPGMKIAQLVFAKFKKAKLKEVNKLNETKRGNNGFGSTTKE